MSALKNQLHGCQMEKKEEKYKLFVKNSQLANATIAGARKPPVPINVSLYQLTKFVNE